MVKFIQTMHRSCKCLTRRVNGSKAARSALTPCANQYTTNPISFLSFNGALIIILALNLIKGFNFLTKCINVPSFI
jgi:hypothetical protein